MSTPFARVLGSAGVSFAAALSLPLELARVWARLEKAGILIVLLVVFILPRMIGIDPVGQALDHILPWAFRTMFWLAGHNVDGVDGNFI